MVVIQDRGSCFGNFINIRTLLPSLAFLLLLEDSYLFSQSSLASNSSFLHLDCLCIKQIARIMLRADFNVTITFLPDFPFLPFFASKYARLLARVLVICCSIFRSAFSHSSVSPKIELVPIVKIDSISVNFKFTLFLNSVVFLSVSVHCFQRKNGDLKQQSRK